jgi:MoaA/NifB/PqqE/SkfB family radical SAM enzyme
LFDEILELGDECSFYDVLEWCIFELVIDGFNGWNEVDNFVYEWELVVVKVVLYEGYFDLLNL